MIILILLIGVVGMVILKFCKISLKLKLDFIICFRFKIGKFVWLIDIEMVLWLNIIGFSFIICVVIYSIKGDLFKFFNLF